MSNTRHRVEHNDHDNDAPSSSAAASSGGTKVEKSFGSDILAQMIENGCDELRRQRPIHIVGAPYQQGTGETNRTTTHHNHPDQQHPHPIASKIIHFQRHGQGYHNVVYENWVHNEKKELEWDSTDVTKNPLVSETVFDPFLTTLGQEQCAAQIERASSPQCHPEIMIVSPLVRAIQTATISWKKYYHDDKNNNNNNTTTATIPWIAHEKCREEFGLLQCNKRRTVQELTSLYPSIDFATYLLNNDPPPNKDDHNTDTNGTRSYDILFDTINNERRRETSIEKSHRIYQFLTDYIMTLPQQEITVVGHSAWLFHMCNAVMEMRPAPAAPSASDPPLDYRTWFSTGEIRSMRVTYFSNEKK